MGSRRRKNYFAYRSFWKEFDAMRDFTAAGFDLFTVFPSNSVNSLGEPYSQYKPLWYWFDTYDFAALDEQFEDVLSINPRAEFLCMIDLNTPLWLARQLACRYELGTESFCTLTDALSNPEWRKHTENYVTAFVDYAEKKYGSRILAYIPACGVTDEWMDYSNGVETPAKLAAYREWARERLPEQPSRIPSREERFAAPHDGGMLRDPAENADALAYWTFHSELVAQGIIGFARLIRSRCLAPKEIGAFYGYINQLNYKRFVQSGHLAYEKVLASPEVDFIISPGSYEDRPMGGFGGFMSPNGSVHRYGKKYMHECDQRTSTFNRKLSPYVSVNYVGWEDAKADVAGVRREFARSLIHGTSLWMFDMWGGFYKGKEVMANLRRCHEIWEKFDDETRQPLSEVAVIVDPESVRYVNDDSYENRRRIARPHMDLLNNLNKLGAPYTVWSFADIPHVPEIGRCKLVFFPALYEVTLEKRELLRKHILNSDRLVVWGDFTGASDGKSWDDGRMAELCGVTMSTPREQTVRMSGWRSRYLGRESELSPAFLREAAREAGVHLYADCATPVFASKDLLMVHCARSGKVKISLPEPAAAVTELFDGSLRFENTDSFELEIDAPETLLFEIVPRS